MYFKAISLEPINTTIKSTKTQARIDKNGRFPCIFVCLSEYRRVCTYILIPILIEAKIINGKRERNAIKMEWKLLK